MGIGPGGMRGHPVSRLDMRPWPCLIFPLQDLNPACSLGPMDSKPSCPVAEERARHVKAVDREPREVREHRVGPKVWRRWQPPGQLVPGSKDHRQSHTSQGTRRAPNGHFQQMGRAPLQGIHWALGWGGGSIFQHRAVSELCWSMCFFLSLEDSLCSLSCWNVPALRPPSDAKLPVCSYASPRAARAVLPPQMSHLLWHWR